MTQARDLADGKFDTNTLVVDAANNRVEIGASDNEGTLRIGDNATYYGEIKRVNASDELRIGHYGSSQNVSFYTAGSERGRFLSGGGLTFNGDTAAANALDDYEEGTWTPAPQFGGNSAGQTFDHGPTGYYTKVGRMVFVWFGFRFSNKGTSTGAFRIRGLPYTIAGTAAYTHPTNIAGGVPSENTKIFQALGSGSEIIYRRLDTTGDHGADHSDFNNGSGWFGSLVYHTD